MKKIVASVGLIAIGASAIQSASAQDFAVDRSKPWSVSATLRGFYDDNTGTIPNDQALQPGEHRDSLGYEISPTVALAWSLEQTTISVGFLYSYKYFENRIPYTASHDSQAFTFNASLNHRFSERYTLSVSDSFVIGQEPDLLRAGNTMATFQRISGDNIRNYGAIGFDAQMTPTLGLNIGYDNAYYDYSDTTETIGSFGEIQPSPAATLNRMEHAGHIEGIWLFQPETKGILGYRYREVDYLGDQPIAGNVFFPSSLVNSDARNSREHTFYVGAQHNFRPDFSASLRAGASYTDYFEDPSADGTWTPYVSGSLRYNYLPDSYVEAGISYDRSATDLAGGGFAAGQGITLDSQAFTIYATINHHFTPKLIGSATGQFQNSEYNGGIYDNESEQYYLAGLALEYMFNPHVSAQLGYNYDNLHSGLTSFPRSFDRNRVYIGITGRY